MKKFAVFAMVTIGIAFAVTSIRAATLDPQSIVYIECTVGGKISKGSGVVVGDDGRILTAKHVVPDGSECRGVRGTGATTPTRGLILGKKSAQYDARILKFVPNNGEKFEPAAYAKLTKEMQGRAITAYGFPLNGTGQLSVRRGSIATTITDQNGLIQTVALTAKGMSGGPVFLDNGKMIGIVSGVRLDRRATPTDFAVLAAQEFAVELGIQKNSKTSESKLGPYMGNWYSTIVEGDIPENVLGLYNLEFSEDSNVKDSGIVRFHMMADGKSSEIFRGVWKFDELTNILVIDWDKGLPTKYLLSDRTELSVLVKTIEGAYTHEIFRFVKK